MSLEQARGSNQRALARDRCLDRRRELCGKRVWPAEIVEGDAATVLQCGVVGAWDQQAGLDFALLHPAFDFRGALVLAQAQVLLGAERRDELTCERTLADMDADACG